MPFVSNNGTTTNDWAQVFSSNLQGNLQDMSMAIKNDAALNSLQVRVSGSSPFSGDDVAERVYTVLAGTRRIFHSNDLTLSGTPPPYTEITIQVRSLVSNLHAAYQFRAVYIE